MSEVNTITLSTNAYNQIKSENQKCTLLLDNILSNAQLSEDRTKLVLDSDSIVLAMNVLFNERYKKKLSALKALATKGKI